MTESDSAPDVAELAREWVADLRVPGRSAAEQEELLADRLTELLRERDHSGTDARRRFDAFFEACPAAAAITDTTGTVVTANPVFADLAAAAEVGAPTGFGIGDLAAAEPSRRLLADALAQVRSRPGHVAHGEVEISVADALSRTVRVSATALPGAGAAVLFLLEDVQELRQLQETFRHQTLHDSLTGLPNEAYLRSKVESMVAAAGAGEQVALLFLDLDGFGVINDGLGPEVANLVLRAVAGTLRLVFAGEGIFLARLFRDEFAVAMCGPLTHQSVVAQVEEMIRKLAEPVYHGTAGVGVSASVGIVVADAAGTDHRSLLRSAEVALHRAKELGKSQWVLFDPETDRAARDRYFLAASLAGAIETGEVGIVYQPQVVLPDAPVITSLKACLSWSHPQAGRLRADEVYALAELTGMTVPLGRHLLAEAVETAADWRDRFGDGAPVVCLNLPQRMAIDADLVGIVRGELARHGLDARRLMLCTNSASLLDVRGDLKESIGVLARLGVVFILDVAGLPDLELVSSLDLPVPGAMLVGPVVAAVAGDDPPEWALRQVRHLVGRADELGVKVGAHGVASQAHADRLFSLGVVVAAGPYLDEYATQQDAEVWVGRVFSPG
ncbi:diguanylate cyclase domain-containing protein [Lentzea sp. NPDC060358]|uniref:diguanylate cyclase domain-containing protein n=1 Tax=Lentzea sp. NPDC060358 TaxID=3347103 RepID=UPI0036581CF0